VQRAHNKHLLSVAPVLFFLILAFGCEDTTPKNSDPKNAIRPLITLDFDWEKGGFDNVMIATFLINNKSDRDIRDITIICDHAAKSGTKLNSNIKTIYEIVKAHNKKRIKNFNMGLIHDQTASSTCKIFDFEFTNRKL